VGLTAWPLDARVEHQLTLVSDEPCPDPLSRPLGLDVAAERVVQSTKPPQAQQRSVEGR